MSTAVITKGDVIADMEALVAEFGADHAVACHYTTRDRDGDWSGEVEPLCIVGQIVYKRFGEDALIQLEKIKWQIIPSEPRAYNFVSNLGFDEQAMKAMYTAQMIQDGQHGDNSWGRALEEAKNVAL